MKFLAIFIITLSLALTGCPSGVSSAINAAIEKDAQAAAAADNAVLAVRTLYENRVISLTAKDEIAKGLQLVIDGGRVFHNALVAVGPNPTAGQLAVLNTVFSDQVITPLLNLLAKVKVVNPSASATLIAYIDTIRASVLAIAQLFTRAGYQTPTMEKLYAYNA